MVKLNDERDRAEWLQCLQSASGVAQGLIATTMAGAIDVEALSSAIMSTTDAMFLEFRKRCEK
jgi:hypothetical protein